MSEWLGYRSGKSPFPINADLVFKVRDLDGVIEVDETGNPATLGAEIQFGCYVVAANRAATREVIPGLEFDRIPVKGRVIERVQVVDGTTERVPVNFFDFRLRAAMVATAKLYYPPVSVADPTIASEILGVLQLDLLAQSPWQAVRSVLGDRFSGYFQQESIDGELTT